MYTHQLFFLNDKKNAPKCSGLKFLFGFEKSLLAQISANGIVIVIFVKDTGLKISSKLFKIKIYVKIFMLSLFYIAICIQKNEILFPKI